MNKKLKSIKTIIVVFFSIFFISISSTTNIYAMNYSYNVEEGEEFIWTVMVGNSAILLSEGSKFRVIIEENYNGTWIEDSTTYRGTILNYSIEVYSTFKPFPIWELAFNGSAMFFNDTTWEIFMGFNTDWEIALFGMLFFIPTPINLTWIGDYLNRTSLLIFDNYSISDSTLIMQNITSNIDFTFTFNNNGTLAEYKVSSGDSIGYHIKYGDIYIPQAQIPFGNYFLIFIPFTTITIIIFTRHKIKKKKN
ncbi:MAG: hypothetical protein ACFE8C_11140 [Promethearchaeota archaeon]